MMRKLVFLFLTATLISACKKDEFEEISNTPSIEFVSITPSTAIEYQDNIIITISYTDGDGDLGENTADVKNLFVTDSRNSVTYEYRIPQLGPSGETLAIQGHLPIEIKNTAITDGSTSQTVTYTVYIKDRAGRVSNTVATTAITVTQ